MPVSASRQNDDFLSKEVLQYRHYYLQILKLIDTSKQHSNQEICTHISFARTYFIAVCIPASDYWERLRLSLSRVQYCYISTLRS